MKAVRGFLILFIFCSCNILLDTDSSVGRNFNDCSENPREALKILFIGNTYTSHNNLPKIFKDLSCSVGIKTEIYSITVQSYRLKDHAEDNATLELIDAKLWDYVVLQNHGQVPSWRLEDVEDQSLPHVQTLVQAIYDRYSATEIFYLQTWGRKTGDQSNCGYYPLVCDLAGHTEALKDGYELYANEAGGRVAPAGDAFLAVFQDNNEIMDSTDLWHEDGAHPSLAGSYLAASVLIAKVFNLSPQGAMPMEELGLEVSLYLQIMAAQSAGL